MRITRAAKVAAFPLTALILVALVACQGPVGPTGAAGPQGGSGPSGPSGPSVTGPTGPTGLGVLQLRKTTTAVIPIHDDLTTGLGTLPAARSVVDYFRGGVPMLEYAVVAPFTESGDAPDIVRTPNTTSTFVPMVSKDGMLTITLRAAGLGRGAADAEYSAGTLFAVKVTDADKVTVERKVRILRNRPPVASDTAGVAFTPLTVGTQGKADTERDDMPNADSLLNVTCAMFNACKVTPTQDTTRTSTSVHFIDDMAGLKFSSSSKSLAVSLTDAADGKTFTVMGVTSTWNPKKLPDAGHEPIIVRVRATDATDDDPGLFVERDMMVMVDGVPTAKEIGTRTYKAAGMEVVLVRDVVGYFTDAESELEVVAASLKSSDMNVATVDDGTGGDEGHIMITPKNPGTTTITIRVAEMTSGNTSPKVDGLGQWVEQTVSVTVTQ